MARGFLATITLVNPGKPSDRLLLYRSWPRRLLNRLSETKKRNHLWGKALASAGQPIPFRLPENLQKVSRFLVIWPDQLSQLFSIFPAVASLKQVWPGCDLLHIASLEAAPFLMAFFEEKSVLPVAMADLRLDDTQYHLASSRIKDFRGDFALLLEPNPTAWHQLLFQLSGSALRCHLGSSVAFPACNLQVQGSAKEPLFQIARRLEPLFRGSGLLPQGLAWIRLQPNASAREDAAKKLHKAQLKSANLWAYIPASRMDSGPEPILLQRLRQKEGDCESFVLSYETEAGNEAQAETLPNGQVRLPVTSLAQLLGLSAWIRGVFGPPSPLLYLFSLTDIEIRTWLSSSESNLDLTAFNARFQVMPGLEPLR